ncbi:Multicopper oxidase domain containing protein [Naviculisporaceae sp. PSN 640]
MDSRRQFRDNDDDDDAHETLIRSSPIHRPEKGTRGQLFLATCCITLLFVLSGLLISGFYAETPGATRPPTPPTEPSPVSETPASANPTTASPTNPPVSRAQQLDLKTGFQISSTPQVRDYVFNITLGQGSPDGFPKSMIFVNGQSPGPLIEANTGDLIRVVVHNNLPEESTAIHWHGIDQRNSNWMDGVHGVTQCGIPPGESFTYAFNVSGQRGTFWYHAHVSLQYTNGLYGPLVIHDVWEQVPKVNDDKVVMFGDFFHGDAEELLGQYLGTSHSGSHMAGTEPPPDNIIINGHHVSNCSSSSSTKDNKEKELICQSGTLYNTRATNTSTPFFVTIDNHTLSIVEMDGTEIEPIATTRVFMNPGQRYSVLLTANQTAGNYKMRVTAAKWCFHGGKGDSNLAKVNYEAIGLLSYDDVDATTPPIGSRWDTRATSNAVSGPEPWGDTCADLPFDLPKPMRSTAAFDVGEHNYHYFTFSRDSKNGTIHSYINNTLYEPLRNDATLWKASKTAASESTVVDHVDNELGWNFGPGQFVMVSKDADSGAQIVINSDAMMMHPFHAFQVVGWGKNTFGQAETTWNLDNPMRRDTVTVPGYSHVVLRIRADNPGIWALHCHILWHAEDGMFVQIGQRLDELQAQLETLDANIQSGGSPFRGRFCGEKR